MKIIFYAPLGYNVPAHMIGGAEIGCRKTLDIYRRASMDVKVVEKVARTNSRIRYLLQTAKTAFKLWGKCLKNRDAVVHFVGFYDKVINIEWVMIRGILLTGTPVAYEMRNGNMTTCYQERGAFYRCVQRSIWRMSKGIICQGQKYIDLIRDEIHRDSFLYPNYIPEGHADVLNFDRPFEDSLNLVFFGRLVENKNIELMIKTAAIIKRRFTQTRLHLIGGIDDNFRSKLDSLIVNEGLSEGRDVIFYGHRDFSFISAMLKKCHFFLFPSSNPTEGHSNSLTEAMGCGVVPIASTAGFNESVVDDETLIVRDLTSEAYAQAILSVIDSGEWRKKSKQVSTRVAENFTQAIVGDRLCRYITQLK